MSNYINRYSELIQIADVQLTDAQIKDLHNTPVTVIPAPGVGLAISPMFIYTYSVITVAYNFVEGSRIILGFSSDPSQDGGGDVVDWNNYLDTAVTIRHFENCISAFNTNGPLKENEALVLANDGDGITGGDAAIVASFRIYYVLVPTTPFGGSK